MAGNGVVKKNAVSYRKPRTDVVMPVFAAISIGLTTLTGGLFLWWLGCFLLRATSAGKAIFLATGHWFSYAGLVIFSIDIGFLAPTNVLSNQWLAALDTFPLFYDTLVVLLICSSPIGLMHIAYVMACRGSSN